MMYQRMSLVLVLETMFQLFLLRWSRSLPLQRRSATNDIPAEGAGKYEVQEPQ